MRYLSVCSGIEAASVAWKPLGWEPVGFSEIERFPCRLLKHHYPDVPNFGDMTKWKEWNLEPGTVDLLCGGTPCQSFSVAGLRKGMDDERGNLALEYCRMAAGLLPRWIVWENVPGVLSSGKGRDFGSIVGALAEIGYGVCWRVLDAQNFGVPQRRRRVWLVGYFGDWRPAAAVLFERESLCGDAAPRRKEGQEIAGTLEARARSGGWSNSADMDAAGYMRVAKCLTKGCSQRLDSETEDFVTTQYGFHAGALTARHNSSPCADRGQNVVAYPINTQIAMRHNAIGERTGLGVGADGDMSFTLQANHCHAVAHGVGNVSGTLRSNPGSGFRSDGSPVEGCVSSALSVRRLTPRECERLQGFPDDYTAIPGAKDGPRYKALGNSWAVPCARWIGERIQLVDTMMKEPRI